MVGHSNLGLADALRRREANGAITQALAFEGPAIVEIMADEELI